MEEIIYLASAVHSFGHGKLVPRTSNCHLFGCERPNRPVYPATTVFPATAVNRCTVDST